MSSDEQATWTDPYTTDSYERVKVDVYENTDPFDRAKGAKRWKIEAHEFPVSAYGDDYAECARNFRLVFAAWRSMRERMN